MTKDQSQHAWLRDVPRPQAGSVYIGHNWAGTATNMIQIKTQTDSDTPIYDALVKDLDFWEEAHLTRISWEGQEVWGLSNVRPEDRNPPWMKRYDDVDQP